MWQLSTNNWLTLNYHLYHQIKILVEQNLRTNIFNLAYQCIVSANGGNDDNNDDSNVDNNNDDSNDDDKDTDDDDDKWLHGYGRG